MKKIIIIFSILLIINITTTKKYPDPLEELINGLPGDSYGVILGKLIDYLKKLLGPILPLNDAELRDLTERLRELKRVELSITSAELQNRANQVAIINKQTGGEWKAKLNLESLLPEKYQRILCGLKQVYKGSKAPRSKRASKGVTKRIVSCTYKRDFDVRDKWSCCKQIISYIPNQGFCGSCWAVATASAYTDRYCIERAKKGLITPNITRNIFSSYDLLSCSMKNGCEGGHALNAWNWIKGNGICTGTDFPRKGGCKPYPISPTQKDPVLQRCTKSCTKTSWRPPYASDRKHYVTSVGNLGGEASIKKQLHEYGPVVAGFEVYQDFHAYRGGVYYRVSGKKVGGHAVVITGYGTATCDKRKIPYWIIKNSWGIGWGEGGYGRFRRGKNDCGFEEDIAYGIPKV